MVIAHEGLSGSNAPKAVHPLSGSVPGVLDEEVAALADQVAVEDRQAVAPLDDLGQVLHLAGVEAAVAEVDLHVAAAGRLGDQQGQPEQEHHADAPR